MNFVKHDKEKLRPLLRAFLEVYRVAEFGGAKYGNQNWTQVPNEEVWRYVEAAWRHIAARAGGEADDKESGLPHLAHAAWCLLVLLDLDIGELDRAGGLFATQLMVPASRGTRSASCE